jgi:methylglutaconyl-CoA hydratase
VTELTLARPGVRNAFDEALIAELTAAFGLLPPGTRAVVVTGEGAAFSAGGDAEWMRRARTYGDAENLRDAAALAAMLRAVDECPVPVLARVNGAAIGGGCGLIAACDIAVAAEEAQFGFSEVRLGLAPAVIAPFVLARIGARAARRYFLTGERFGSGEAVALGLLHEAVPSGALDGRIEALTGEILLGGPQSVREAKRLIRELLALSREQALDHAVRAIARLRRGPEAQEGLGAFLEKRKPQWP